MAKIFSRILSFSLKGWICKHLAHDFLLKYLKPLFLSPLSFSDLYRQIQDEQIGYKKILCWLFNFESVY